MSANTVNIPSQIPFDNSFPSLRSSENTEEPYTFPYLRFHSIVIIRYFVPYRIQSIITESSNFQIQKRSSRDASTVVYEAL